MTGETVESMMAAIRHMAPALLNMDTADISAVSRFIDDVERGPMAVKVDSLEITERDKTGDQLTMSVEINGLALNQPDKK